MAIRLDKWLWAARFYKTRRLATEAVQGGHVHLNGVRSKPAKSIDIADELIITKGLYKFTVRVLELSDKRGSASIAQMLYQETEQSKALRDAVNIQRKNHAMPAPVKRPDKRDRAKIIRFKNKYVP